MKLGFGILSLCVMSFGACKTTHPSALVKNEDAAPETIKTVSMAVWKNISDGKNVVELGCVCEEADTAWNLYRYASAAMDVYKITLSEKTALDACIKAKFNGDNCKLKF